LRFSRDLQNAAVFLKLLQQFQLRLCHLRHEDGNLSISVLTER
jgi:hypothetical protein